MRKSLPLLLVLALFAIVSLILYQITDRDSAPADALRLASTKLPAEQTHGPSGGRAPAGRQERQKPANLSPPSWRPPATFAATGKSTAALVFPRGENASRRYHKVVSRDMDPEHSSAIPAVLAKSPEDGRFHLLPEEIDEHTLIAGRMVFDPTSLDRIVDGTTSSLLAPTLSGEVLTLEFQKIKTRSASTHTLQGRVVGEESSSSAQIVYHDGILHGSVILYDSQQEIEYRILADGHMMVRELDHSNVERVCETCQGYEADIEQEVFSSNPVEGDPPEDGDIAYDTSGWRTMDIVVGYDRQARIDDGGHAQIEARIIASVDRTTQAFANSQIADTELMLLGTIEDPYYVFPGSNPTSMVDELSALANESDGNLDEVTGFANRLGADFVSFVISGTQGGGSGIARFSDKYSINNRGSMTAGEMVFEHEFGHNLGCAHAWGDTAADFTQNRGWRLKTTSGAQVTTIMAYTSGWGGRIPYYSNPNVSYGGARTGAVNGYDARGDATVDPRLAEGGMKGYTTITGYDGSHPTLGANNAAAIDTGEGTSGGATIGANRATRTAFDVISPAAAAQWERGTTQTIQFNGGDMKDLAAIKLYKGGVLHSILASGINPATHRNFTWTVPFALTDGTDYMIRVELDSNGGTLMADSGIFTVFSDPPYVIASSAPAVPEGVGVVSKVVLTFNVPMDPATFSPASDIVSFTDPIGNSVISSITGTDWSAGNSVLTIHFTPQSQPGTYQLVIGPDIADTFGSLMDQDRDGASGETVEDRYISQFTVNPPLIYQANMDTDPGWTFSDNNPVTDGWAYGQPTGQGANPYRNNDPNSGFTGPNVVGYNLNGDYQTSIPDTRWATTPAFDCSGQQDVILSFHRWLGVSANDYVYIQVSNDGSSWTTVWENPVNQNFDDNAWAAVEYDISAVADGQATVYVRWGLGRTFSNGNGGASGWNIDDVVIYGNLPDNLAVTPAGTLAASGLSGGPFSPSSIQYTLQNTGLDTIQWTAGKTVDWVSLSASSGTLAAGASTMVTVSINSQADAYGVGDYSDLITFTNATAGVISATRSVDLEVLGPGTLRVSPAGDFASSGIYGDGSGFAPSSFEYTLTNGGVTSIDWTAVKTQSWVTLSAVSGALAPAASTTVTVSINNNADALNAGTYADTVSFFNITNESGDTTRGISLTVYPAPANLYWDANGNTAGAGGNPGGTWGTSNFWNTDSAGAAGTFSNSTSITSNLFFVAGPASNSGNNNATITVSGIQSANSLTSQHSGAFTLNGGSSNPLGSISLGNGTAGQGGITVNEFAFGSTAQGKLSISAPVSLNNSQTWTNNKVDPDYRQQAPGLDFTAAAGNAPNGLTLNHALTIDGKGVTSLSSNTATTITGTGGIIKNGTGTLILSTAITANSAWSGGLTVNGGLVRFQNASNLGTGNINLAGGVLEGRSSGTTSSLTTLSLGSSANQIRITGGVSGFSAQSGTATTFTISGTNPLVWGSSNFNPGEFVLQAATANTGSAATFTNGIDLNSGTRTIRSDQTGGLASGGVATFSNRITGTGNLIKTGIGHVFLSTVSLSNNYTGTTTVSQGTLTVESIASLPGYSTPGRVTVAGGATLGVRPGSWGSSSIDSLRNNVTWSDTSSELGFSPGSTSVTYSSNITQALSIHKYGTSTLVLTGSSSFPGTTKLSQGTLAFNSIANVGGGNSALGAPATVANGTIALGSGTAAVIFRYTGTGHSTDRVLDLSNTTGGVTLDMSGTGTLTFTSALTATGAGSKTLTLSGLTEGIGELGGAIPNSSVAGTTAVTKSGTNTWILSGNNTYTGATNVSAGTLLINGNQAAATGNISVAASATLGGTGTLGGNTIIAAGGKLEFNLSTAAASHDRLDISSGRSFAFSGASELTITSSGGAVPGIYTLITGGNNITGSAPATLNLPSGWAATVSISGNSLLLDVTSTGGPGPVDHFVISAIASPQTVGTAITGITITAKDASNETATSFTGTVTFGGTAGITGTSVNFVAGVLSDVSVTPTVAGSNRNLTVGDGAGHTGYATFTVQSIYANWSNGPFANSLIDSDPALDFDGGSLPTGIEWVLGGDPTDGADDAGITPTIDRTTDPDGKLLFTFRRAAAAKIDANTTIAVQYGGALGTWTNAVHQGTAADQITITEEINGFGAGLDKVTVALPASLANGGKLFARLHVAVAVE